jgi:hypothetical protein
VEELIEVVESIRQHAINFDSRGTAKYMDDLGEIDSRVLHYNCCSCNQDFNKPRRFYGDMLICWAVERGHYECPILGCSRVSANSAELCNGSADNPHTPQSFRWRAPHQRTNVFMDWGEFTQYLRNRGIAFHTLNRLEVNGKPFFTHENPAASVEIPDSHPTS